MPVYYGVDLCDSDDSEDLEWEDPWNLAYAEHVDQYNFDALDGMELKVYERLQAGNDPVNMVGSATAVNTLPDGHDVSSVVDSPVHWTFGVPAGGRVALYYEGDLSDLSDSDCESVEDHERHA